MQEYNGGRCYRLPQKTGGNLRILTPYNTDHSLSDIQSVTTSFSLLVELGLSGGQNLNGGDLRILNLRDSNVSLSGIDSLTVMFSQLEELDLLCCQNLSDAGIGSAALALWS